MKKILVIVIAVLSVAAAAFAVSPLADEACRACRGRGWNTCNMCDGHGWRECTFCGGEGYVEKRDGTKEVCANCHGKRGFKCGYCRGGQKTCTACNGTGKQRKI